MPGAACGVPGAEPEGNGCCPGPMPVGVVCGVPGCDPIDPLGDICGVPDRDAVCAGECAARGDCTIG